MSSTANTVELAAAVAQQQRAQNATRVSDEVKQQLLAAAAKRLAKAQGAVAIAPAYTLAEINTRTAELDAKEIYTQTGEVSNSPGLYFIATFGNHAHRLSQWLAAQGATVAKSSKYEPLDNHVVAYFTLAKR